MHTKKLFRLSVIISIMDTKMNSKYITEKHEMQHTEDYSTWKTIQFIVQRSGVFVHVFESR